MVLFWDVVLREVKNFVQVMQSVVDLGEGPRGPAPPPSLLFSLRKKQRNDRRKKSRQGK